jgi:hypothetical protein
MVVCDKNSDLAAHTISPSRPASNPLEHLADFHRCQEEAGGIGCQKRLSMSPATQFSHSEKRRAKPIFNVSAAN